MKQKTIICIVAAFLSVVANAQDYNSIMNGDFKDAINMHQNGQLQQSHVKMKSLAEKGFPFPVKLETAQKTVFDMSSDEFEEACQAAVAQRENYTTMDYVTRLDKESGMLTKVYADGRVEYVLE